MSEVDVLTAASHSAAPSKAKLRLTRPHKLIQRTIESKEVKDKWGYVSRPAWQGVDVRVSKGAKRNALIVLDRLFKALEKRGIEVSVFEGGRYDTNGTFAVRDHYDKVQLFVTEDNKKVPHEPTAAELRYKEEHKYSARIPKYDSVPTGVLRLTPGGIVDLTSEETLGKLVDKATDEVVQKLDEATEHRKVAEAERRRQMRRETEEREEKARAEALIEASAAFRRYREMMDYIEEVRRFGSAPDNQRKEGQSLDEWLKWAERRARCMHPLG